MKFFYSLESSTIKAIFQHSGNKDWAICHTCGWAGHTLFKEGCRQNIEIGPRCLEEFFEMKSEMECSPLRPVFRCQKKLLSSSWSDGPKTCYTNQTHPFEFGTGLSDMMGSIQFVKEVFGPSLQLTPSNCYSFLRSEHRSEGTALHLTFHFNKNLQDTLKICGNLLWRAHLATSPTSKTNDSIFIATIFKCSFDCT